jgi:Polysaccharide pyruvyl transferase
MRALVIGHFSTVGDIEVLREVERQLVAASMPWDVAPLARGMCRFSTNWRDIHNVNPPDYTHLLVVCGPFWRPYYLRRRVDLDAFAHCTRIGVNLSMIEGLNAYNPFDRLIGRDNDSWARPDVSFLHETSRMPVAGLCLVKSQSEYGKRQKHDHAGDLLRRMARRNGLAIVELDTEWPEERNSCGLASPEAFESACARMDVMLTTRLHGTVLALKNGVPVIAIDAISGGGKVLRQAEAIGWPEAFSIDRATDCVLDEALARCLQPSGRDRADACAASARQALAGFSHDLAEALRAAPEGRPSFTGLAERPSRFQRKLKKITGRLAHFLPGRAG